MALGVYYYSVSAGDFSAVRKSVLMDEGNISGQFHYIPGSWTASIKALARKPGYSLLSRQLPRLAKRNVHKAF